MTSKQRSYLKSLAHHLKPVFQIGKDGIGENMITDIRNYLVKHELMKITILNNSMVDFEEATRSFEENHIIIVQKIGNTMVLYKRSSKAIKPIILPKQK
ncbi:MAG: YhbY family RNA-binding protein [Anaeroplasmataceae bacterium]